MNKSLFSRVVAAPEEVTPISSIAQPILEADTDNIIW